MVTKLDWISQPDRLNWKSVHSPVQFTLLTEKKQTGDEPMEPVKTEWTESSTGSIGFVFFKKKKIMAFNQNRTMEATMKKKK